MATLDRKPPAPMESRDPKSIRFTPSEWLAICDGARQRGLEPAVFTRMLAMYGLSIAQAPTLAEGSTWIPGRGAQMLAGSPRTRRFSQVLVVATAAYLLAACTHDSALTAMDRAAAMGLMRWEPIRPSARLCDWPMARARCVEVSKP